MANADTFHVQGEIVYFRGFEVARLLTSDAPVTVLDQVELALHAYHPDAIDPDEHKGDLDALEEAEWQLHDAKERISELERELEDERDSLARVQEREAELEELLAAEEAVSNDLRSQVATLESLVEAFRP